MDKKPKFAQNFINSVQFAGKNYIYALSKNRFSLLGLFLMVSLLSAYIMYMLNRFPHDDMMRMTNQLGLGLTGLLQTLTLLFIIPKTLHEKSMVLKEEPFGDFSKRVFVPTILEGLRVMWRVLLGFILLVIPGIVLSVFYYFVIYVVFFDPGYQKGDVDALKKSKSLTKPIFFSLLFVYLVEFGVNTGLQFFELPNADMATQIAFKCFIMAIALMVAVFFHCVYYGLFFHQYVNPKEVQS